MTGSVDAVNMQKRTDDAYIEQCIQDMAGDDLSGMERLYSATSTAIYAYALSLLKHRSDAEDVTHDVYLSVYRASNQYKRQGKPLAWMFTITKNLCLEKVRKQQRIASEPIDESYYLLEENGLSVEEKETLRLCMTILNDEEREIVILHAVSGFKHREIAKITNKSLPAVLSKYNRAIKKVREKLLEVGK